MHVWTSQSLGPLHVSGKRKHSYAHPNPAMSFQQFEKHKRSNDTNKLSSDHPQTALPPMCIYRFTAYAISSS